MPSRAQRIPVLFSSSGFNLKSIPGLALWLRADKGAVVSSGKVQLWQDQSGFGNDFVNAVSATSPLYNAFKATLNNKPTVQFVNGSSYYLANASFVQSGTSHTLMVAYAPDSVTAVQEILFSETGQLAFAHVAATTGQMGYYDGTAWRQAGVSTSPTGAHTVAFNLVGGGSGYIYKDGTLLSTTTYTSKSLSARCGLGASYDGTAQYLNAHIAELAYWNRSLSAAEMDTVQAYYKLKYGTP